MEKARFDTRVETESFVSALDAAATVRLGDHDDIDLTRDEALDYIGRARDRDLRSSEPCDPFLVQYETDDPASERAAFEAADRAPFEAAVRDQAQMTEDGETSDILHQASKHDEWAPWIGKVVAAGADVNARDDEGRTPLHIAVIYGQTEVVRALLDAGADVHTEDEEGETALHFAASGGGLEIAAALLDAGALPQAVNDYGKTPLHEACGRSMPKYPRPGAMVSLLLDAGADIDARDEDGETAEKRAQISNNTAAAEALAAHRRRVP